jgi:hypothetical protein
VKASAGKVVRRVLNGRQNLKGLVMKNPAHQDELNTVDGGKPGAKPQPLGTDHSEPRTGYRPELDERTDRFDQYGMVRDAEPGETAEPRVNDQHSLTPPSAPEVDHAPEDAFESEFMSRQANTGEGEADGRGAMWGTNGDEDEDEGARDKRNKQDKPAPLAPSTRSPG